MYKKETFNGTTVHTFAFSPELYEWTYEVGISQQLETLKAIYAKRHYTGNGIVNHQALIEDAEKWKVSQGEEVVSHGREIISKPAPDTEHPSSPI